MLLNYIKKYGIPTGGEYNDTYNSCQPFFMKKCEHFLNFTIYGKCENIYSNNNNNIEMPKFIKKCNKNYIKNNFENDLYYIDDYYEIEDEEEYIMTEIMKRGSVSATFNIYEDFLNYKKGIYEYSGDGK